MFGRAASLQAKKVMSLGHLRRQVDIARSIVCSAADELLYDVCMRAFVLRSSTPSMWSKRDSSSKNR